MVLRLRLSEREASFILEILRKDAEQSEQKLSEQQQRISQLKSELESYRHKRLTGAFFGQDVIDAKHDAEELFRLECDFERSLSHAEAVRRLTQKYAAVANGEKRCGRYKRLQVIPMYLPEVNK
jgi:cell division septum initiation protein DivIVA